MSKIPVVSRFNIGARGRIPVVCHIHLFVVPLFRQFVTFNMRALCVLPRQHILLHRQIFLMRWADVRWDGRVETTRRCAHHVSADGAAVSWRVFPHTWFLFQGTNLNLFTVFFCLLCFIFPKIKNQNQDSLVMSQYILGCNKHFQDASLWEMEDLQRCLESLEDISYRKYKKMNPKLTGQSGFCGVLLSIIRWIRSGIRRSQELRTDTCIVLNHKVEQ